MKRFWRILKYLGLALLAIVGISLTWLAVANARASARLEQKLAELRATGEPLSLADLARKPIPPEDNAATYLRRAKNDVQAIQLEVTAADEACSAAEQKAFEEGHLSPAMVKAIRAAFESYPHAMPLLEKASECADFDPQLNFNTDLVDVFVADMLPHMQDSRSDMRVLNYRALLLLADGQREEALRTSLIMFRLCRHFDRNPTLVGYLVAVACRGVSIFATDLILRSGPLPDSAYAALEAELARQDMAKLYRLALITERAHGLQSFREIGISPAGYMMLPMGKNDQCDYLEYMDVVIQGASRPYSDPRVQDDARRILDRAGVLTRAMEPGIQATQDAHCRGQAQMRCLRVLNALARRDRSGENREPKLTDLGLPPEAITDPFNGKPLHLKKLPDGWLIYSVGKNLKDDGGTLTDEREDVGLGPPLDKSCRSRN
jgi:hypothetical protein